MKNCSYEVRELPELKVVKCGHKGDYAQICSAFEKLMKEASQQGLIKDEPKMAAIYHDCPSKPVAELRSDACLITNDTLKGESELVEGVISGGKYFVGRFEVTMEEFSKIWNDTYEKLMEMGLEWREGDNYELYLNDASTHPDNMWIVDICVPVK